MGIFSLRCGEVSSEVQVHRKIFTGEKWNSVLNQKFSCCKKE